MVIQIRQFVKDNVKKENERLAKLLKFLDEERIEYDLEPPVKFKGWKSVGDKTWLVK